MEFDSYGVIKVKGKIFWIIWANPKQPKPHGFLFRTSDNMTETEVRDELARMGLGYFAGLAQHRLRRRPGALSDASRTTRREVLGWD